MRRSLGVVCKMVGTALLLLMFLPIISIPSQITVFPVPPQGSYSPFRFIIMMFSSNYTLGYYWYIGVISLIIFLLAIALIIYGIYLCWRQWEHHKYENEG